MMPSRIGTKGITLPLKNQQNYWVLTLVVVQLGKEDDAQSIFSSLNGNAEPLTSFDLIRNDIFHRARRALEDNDLLYNDQWKQLETSFWKTEVKQGRLKRPRTDHLITHTLVAETGQDVNVGQVANEYMKYAEKKAFSSVSHEIQNLLKYARSYAVMENKKEKTSLVSLSVFLRFWDTSAFHPLVLWIDVQELTDEQKTVAFSVLESYIVRRDLCGLTNKNYNKIVAAALRELHNSSNLLESLIKEPLHKFLIPLSIRFL